MKIAKITGNVTATIKDPKLSGAALLLADVIDGKGQVLEPSVVVADTCSAGVGDTVLVVFGSAARLPASSGGQPVDASIIAVVDYIDIPNGGTGRSSSTSRSTTSKRRK